MHSVLLALRESAVIETLRCPLCQREAVRILAEHTYPHPSHPARYLAQCEQCLRYQTVGFVTSKKCAQCPRPDGHDGECV